MAIVLDHTIVPAKDKVASAEFFAEIFGLKVKPGQGRFAQVQINESLTFDFADEPEAWAGRVSTPGRQEPSLCLPYQRGGVRGDLRPVKPRDSPTAVGHTTTPTARFIPAGAGEASIRGP